MENGRIRLRRDEMAMEPLAPPKSFERVTRAFDTARKAAAARARRKLEAAEPLFVLSSGYQLPNRADEGDGDARAAAPFRMARAVSDALRDAGKEVWNPHVDTCSNRYTPERAVPAEGAGGTGGTGGGVGATDSVWLERWAGTIDREWIERWRAALRSVAASAERASRGHLALADGDARLAHGLTDAAVEAIVEAHDAAHAAVVEREVSRAMPLLCRWIRALSRAKATGGALIRLTHTGASEARTQLQLAELLVAARFELPVIELEYTWAPSSAAAAHYAARARELLEIARVCDWGARFGAAGERSGWQTVRPHSAAPKTPLLSLVPRGADDDGRARTSFVLSCGATYVEADPRGGGPAMMGRALAAVLAEAGKGVWDPLLDGAPDVPIPAAWLRKYRAALLSASELRPAYAGRAVAAGAPIALAEVHRPLHKLVSAARRAKGSGGALIVAEPVRASASARALQRGEEMLAAAIGLPVVRFAYPPCAKLEWTVEARHVDGAIQRVRRDGYVQVARRELARARVIG